MNKQMKYNKNSQHTEENIQSSLRYATFRAKYWGVYRTLEVSVKMQQNMLY